MTKLRKKSKLFRIIFQCCLYAIPCWAALSWSMPHYFLPGPLSMMKWSGLTITPWRQVLALLVSMLYLSVFMYGISELIGLFKQYEQGKIFNMKNINRYRHLGNALIYGTIARWVSDLIVSYIMTANAHSLHTVLTISGDDILMILIGSIIVLISWVMLEGNTLSNEHASII